MNGSIIIEHSDKMIGEPLTEEPLSTTVTVANPMGLHLRTGKEVVQLANQFEAQIMAQNLTRESPLVSLKSILEIMQLQARQGHDLLVRATGPDAQIALDALCALLGQ